MTEARSDAIGLSERLRFDAARCEIHFSKGVASNIEEAAAALDALQARVDCYSENLQEAFDALKQEKARATSAEQERDEALERLKPFADAAESLNESHLDRMDLWESPIGLEITAGHLRAARDLVRRLAAGTEKEGK